MVILAILPDTSTTQVTQPDETSNLVEDSSSTLYTEPDKISRIAEDSSSTDPIKNVSGPTKDPVTEPLTDDKVEGKKLAVFFVNLIS